MIKYGWKEADFVKNRYYLQYLFHAIPLTWSMGTATTGLFIGIFERQCVICGRCCTLTAVQVVQEYGNRVGRELIQLDASGGVLRFHNSATFTKTLDKVFTPSRSNRKVLLVNMIQRRGGGTCLLTVIFVYRGNLNRPITKTFLAIASARF